MVNNERIIVSIESIDVDTIEITSAVAAENAKVTIVGA
jgi:hypothetical protein